MDIQCPGFTGNIHLAFLEGHIGRTVPVIFGHEVHFDVKSFQTGKGSEELVAVPTAEGRITCPLTTPGRPEVQSAYRSEAAGLYGIATAVKIICQVFAIRKGECVIACDGEAALKECTDKDPNIFIKAAQYDLVMAT